MNSEQLSVTNGLYITKKLLDEIKAEGEKAYPDECCGVLLGLSGENGDKTVKHILPVENAHSEDEQYHRFLITPDNMLDAEKKARALLIDVLGFYHSHPDHPSRPSDFDREHALPFYSYIITAVEEGTAKKVTSWALKDDRSEFNAENIIIK
ncbi:MAG: M67 family metallopeptidase [Treponema sp.]|jgi:proteasome lid subunit RPN8/RPN11|nr:M67 family metallopeptidase [Treponema sp.]